MPEFTREFAPAKVNLSLHVTGQRGDGYHILDSLVVFGREAGDWITVKRADETAFHVTGPMAAGVPVDDSNLVIRAAQMIGVTPQITLEKHLPAAAGIGGGSSDAAATLRALARIYDLPLPADFDQLGADVPVCICPRAQRMQGIGDQLTILPEFPALPALLVNPRVDVPTGAVFRGLVSKTNPPMGDIPQFANAADCINWLKTTRNDLEQPAKEIAPIQDVLDALRATGAKLARMSGSGATCFGLYDTMVAAEQAEQSLPPEWWMQATPLY